MANLKLAQHNKSSFLSLYFHFSYIIVPLFFWSFFSFQNFIFLFYFLVSILRKLLMRKEYNGSGFFFPINLSGNIDWVPCRFFNSVNFYFLSNFEVDK